jgi:hypothetical protein
VLGPPVLFLNVSWAAPALLRAARERADEAINIVVSVVKVGGGSDDRSAIFDEYGLIR